MVLAGDTGEDPAEGNMLFAICFVPVPAPVGLPC